MSVVNSYATNCLQYTLHVHAYHRFAGEKEDMINVEEQFLNGIYTPEFLKGQDENDTSLDSAKTGSSKERPNS